MSRDQKNMFVSVDDLVAKDHPYRQFEQLIDFNELCKLLKDLYSHRGRKELGAERGFRMLVLQFTEDISDREMERYVRENMAAKWFCQFSLTEKTPDHSYFGYFRKRLGAERLMGIFNTLRQSLKKHGLMREIFTFVDASQLVSKLSTWSDRDKAIAQGLEKFDNSTASKVAADSEARFGCKGKDKYWYGYKEHTSVDMQSGLINKVSVTPADITDAQGLADICPDQGAVFGDKGYCVEPAQDTIKKKGCHDATIKKNNMIGKDTRKDYWLSQMRSPYERVFSKRSNRVRYRSVTKVQFQATMNALVHNFKRLIKLRIKYISLSA